MSLGKDADNRSMSLTLLILVLSFSVYAGPFIRYRAYEYERVNVTRSNQGSEQNRFAPRPEDIGFRSYATELRPQRPQALKPKRREFGFRLGRR